MKTLLGLRRCHYMARLSIFLIIIALVIEIAGCSTNPISYTLTISNTEGGEVMNPGEGVFTYKEVTIVNLVATPDSNYRFVKWSGDVGTIGDVNAATTIITINGNYSIMANFAPDLEMLEIRDWYDLDDIRNNLVGNYLLMNDLNSITAGYTELAGSTANDGKGWQPIGTENQQFTGVFNGQGYEIKGLLINRSSESYVGLFGAVVGTVQDVGVVNANINGRVRVGCLVGENNYGTVNNCYATGSVNGISEESGRVGGLVGRNYYGTVNNCYATCSVTSAYCGGLVGYNDHETVNNCYATGSVTFQSAFHFSIGGLVGYNTEGTVINSFWDTETSGQAISWGGIGKTTAEMKEIDTFLDTGWNIVAVANRYTRNLSYIWNMVDDETYPFLSWQPIS